MASDRFERPDPRCPTCHGKVSATARWCMHCGAEFDSPVDENADDDDGPGLLGSLRGDRQSGDTTRSVDVETGIDQSRASVGLSSPGSDSRGSAPTVTQRVAESVGASEGVRRVVALVVPVVVWLLVRVSVSLGLVSLLGAVALAAILYTRPTLVETLAAGAYGSGLLVGGLHLLDAWRVATTTDATLVGALAGAAGWFVFGGLLLVVGVWLHNRQ